MSRKTNILFAHSTSVEVNDAGELPTEINFLPLSGFTGRDGRGPFHYDFDKLLESFTKNGRPLPIDYDHQMLTAREKSGPVPAAGWIDGLRYDPSCGVMAHVKQWTPKGAEALRAREYRDFSPVFRANNSTGEITWLWGGAITNSPNLELEPVVNSQDADGAPVSYTEQQPPEDLTQMDFEQIVSMLRDMLGLPLTATGDEIAASVKTLCDQVAAGNTAVACTQALATELGTEPTADAATLIACAQTKFATDLTGYAPVAELQEMTQRATAAEGELTQIKAKAAVKAAIDAGKFCPAQREHLEAMALDSLQKFTDLAEVTPVMPLAQGVTAPVAIQADDKNFGLNAEQVAHCAKYQIDLALYANQLKTA